MAFLSAAYPWIKAVHIIAVISWMAGLLYLPRLFVYHSQAKPGSDRCVVFKIMEQRLYKIIMTPAMTASWIFGALLIATPGVVSWSGSYWLYAKLVLVLGLSGVHVALGRQVRIFSTDSNRRPPAFFKILNEVPTVIMIGVVILVVVRPF